METQFKFLIPNRKAHRLRVVWLTMFFAVPLLFVTPPFLRGPYDFSSPYQRLLLSGLAIVWIILLIGSFLLPWLIRKYLSDATLFSIYADRFTALSQATGVEKQWPFANIASYYVLPGKAGVDVSLKLTDGRRQRLHCPDFDFMNFTHALGHAIRFYEAAQGIPARKQRNFSFFEAPMSTGFLCFYALIMILMAWAIGIPEPSDPSFFMLFFFGFCFLLYFIAWFSARKARQEY